MKKLSIILLTLLLAFGLLITGCSSENEEPIQAQTVKVAALSGPTGMGISEMIVNKPELAKGVDLDISIANAPDQITADIINGTYQFASVPTNLAATLYNKTEGKVRLAAVNTLGVLSIVGTKDETIGSIADMKGKVIGATGQGAVPEYVLYALLEKYDINPETDVTIQWYAEHAQAAQALMAGEISYSLLPEPFATTAIVQSEGQLTQLIDINEAWEEAFGTQLMQGALIVNTEWADSNPALLASFMDAYKKSVESINADTDESAQYVVDAGILPNKELAKKAIPECAMTFIPAEEAKTDLNGFLEMLYDFNKASIGGSLPGVESDFYGLTW